MTFRELDKLLKQNGWIKTRTRGSHVQYKKINSPNIVTVPNHGSKDIKSGTLKNILKQAGLE